MTQQSAGEYLRHGQTPFFRLPLADVRSASPYAGAGAVLPVLIASQVQRIAYVSCHPVSFARDAAMLEKAGFTLARLKLFDMFPHTTHVETLGVFERAKRR